MRKWDDRIKRRLNTDTSPQNFWTTFLDNDLTEKFKKNAVANAIAIPLPLCFSCFVPLRRFRENLIKPFYLYLSRTWDSPGVTPSVISLALRLNWTEIFFLFVVSLSPILYVIFWISYQLHAIEILMDINSFFTQIIYYFKTQLNFLSIQHFCGLYEYIKFFNFGLKNIDSDRRDTWHHWRSRRPFHTCSCCTVSLLDLLFICAASARKHS